MLQVGKLKRTSSKEGAHARAFPGCASVFSVDLWRSSILLVLSVAASSPTWFKTKAFRCTDYICLALDNLCHTSQPLCAANRGSLSSSSRVYYHVNFTRWPISRPETSTIQPGCGIATLIDFIIPCLPELRLSIVQLDMRKSL